MHISWGNVFKMQCRRLYLRSEAKYALTAMLVVVVAGFVESCLHFYGSDLAELPSASYGWAGNMDNMQIQTFRVLYYLLIFLIAASVFGDSFLVDTKSGMSSIIATRSSTCHYVVSSIIVAFLGGFVVILLPLIISQLLAFVVFPFEAPANSFSQMYNTSPSDSAWSLAYAQNALFPVLYFNYPYLNNFIFMVYVSFWAGIMSMMSCVVSLYTRKSRLIVWGIPTLVYLLLLFVMPSGFKLAYYFYPYILSGPLSLTFFMVIPLVMIMLLVAITCAALFFKKDILL